MIYCRHIISRISQRCLKDLHGRRSVNLSKCRNIISLVENQAHCGKTAIIDRHNEYTYDSISRASHEIRKGLSMLSLTENSNICFLCNNDANYIHALLGIWKSGNVAVPLCKSHPLETLKYYITDSEASILLVSE